jgi:RNA polymerase sigma factor (sigma-70 family)
MSQQLFSFGSAHGSRRAAWAGSVVPAGPMATPGESGEQETTGAEPPPVADGLTGPARSEEGATPSGNAAPPGSIGLGRAGHGLSGLFRERHAELVRLAVLVVGDRATAEDVVQDVFARLCAKDLLPSRESSVAYVRAAVLNGCRSTLRRRAVARRIGGARKLLLDSGDPAGSAEDEVIMAEDRRKVLAALATLPVRRREVLVLRYWLGLSEAEIAATLAISPGTVKSSAARGIAALARKLGEEA